MWSAYSATILLFLLLLVEASFGRRLVGIPTDDNKTCGRTHNNNKLRDWYPDGNVTVRWDVMNKTSDSYTANITIFNFWKNHDIIGPWEFGWKWIEEEILLSTVGATGTQHSYVLVGDNDCCLNSVTVVDLPPQTEPVVANCCKGGVIHSWHKEADLAKSSSSFQISVGQVNVEYHPPPSHPTLITPSSKYICDSFIGVATTRGYLETWTTDCWLYDPSDVPNYHNKEDL